ncbi:MAG: 50S ribosomal protein L3 [Acidobacteria bacterium]|nr:50S ribosomal protein L3 [Acidobacteriota bacterium]
MSDSLIGIKVGMTQRFDSQGNVVSVTVIKAGPCVVTQRKTKEKDGYDAVQVGFVEGKKIKAVTHAMEGHFRKAGVPPAGILREFQYLNLADLKVGDQLLVGSLFKENDVVKVSGISKGHGFAGVVKRHGFRGGRATHGSMFHRAPGSIGASAFPSRVLPGMRAAGRMGNEKVTIRGLRVVAVDIENHLLLVNGVIPGRRGGYVIVSK